MAKPDDGLIGVATAAQLLKVTPRTVQKLTKDGWIEKAGHGQYSLVNVVQGYISYQQSRIDELSRKNADKNVSTERYRRLKTENDLREGKLIEVTEARAMLQSHAGTVRSRLTSLPARLTRDKSQRAKARREINTVLGEIAADIKVFGSAEGSK